MKSFAAILVFKILFVFDSETILTYYHSITAPSHVLFDRNSELKCRT